MSGHVSKLFVSCYIVTICMRYVRGMGCQGYGIYMGDGIIMRDENRTKSQSNKKEKIKKEKINKRT